MRARPPACLPSHAPACLPPPLGADARHDSDLQVGRVQGLLGGLTVGMMLFVMWVAALHGAARRCVMLHSD